MRSLFISLTLIFFSHTALALPQCTSVLQKLGKPSFYKFKRGHLKGHKMAYLIEKPRNWNGKTMVFVPGFSRNMRFWESQAKHYYDQGYQIFRYDPFNIGLTLKEDGLFRNIDGFSFNKDIKAISQILNYEKINQNLIIVGHSLGSAKTVFLTRALEKKWPRSIDQVFIASPFVRFLDDYYQEVNSDKFSKPFTSWNPFSGVPFVGDAINAGIKTASVSAVAAGSALTSSYITGEAIMTALNERDDIEDVGIDRYLEEKALREVMESLLKIDVTQEIGNIEADIHLLTGDDDELIVPTDLVEELKASAPEGMTHTIIESDHFTPSKKDYLKWIDERL